ncbi:MAG: tetratricopeptide repeat protein [Bacteroidia bacterium]
MTRKTIGYSVKLICILAFFLLFISFSASSQTLKTLLRQGEEAMKEKDYFNAAQIYNQIILVDSSQMDYQYKYAEASRLNYDTDIAEHWYQVVFKKDNGKLYPEVTFWLGEILKSKARYKEAKKMFNKYSQKNRSSKDPEKKKLAVKAKMESESCDLALILMKNPVDVKIEHLDSNVNSKVSEYAPFEFDSILYFSSLRFSNDRDKANNINYNKLYTSTNRNEKWMKAKALDSLFNKNGIHTANTCFNKTLTTVYVTRCQQLNASTFNCGIYYSEYKNNSWSELQALPQLINSSGNNTQPNVGEIKNEEYLFFSSNRSGGEGGMDVWFSKINKDGTYDAPVNAGKKVNSVEDEITPFFVSANQTLYFSSTWHKGLGGFDIFKSLYKDGKFGEPENAGYPINSPLNDIYYSVSTRKNRAYISSNRIGSYFEEKQSCCNDIYSFSIPSLEEPPPPVDSSKILINQMKVLVPLTLFFHNDEPNPKTKAIVTTKTYKKTYDEYIALKPKYEEEYPHGLEGDPKTYALNRVQNFFEDSVEAGMHDLDRFAELLEKVLARGEKVKITMKGFCSPLASTDYNVNLAKRRVSSLQNYFKEYKNGMFVKYINNTNEAEGRIEFFEEDIGELSQSKVSDDVKDTRNSVYSPYAAAERKIQIIAVSYLK